MEPKWLPEPASEPSVCCPPEEGIFTKTQLPSLLDASCFSQTEALPPGRGIRLRKQMELRRAQEAPEDYTGQTVLTTCKAHQAQKAPPQVLTAVGIPGEMSGQLSSLGVCGEPQECSFPGSPPMPGWAFP